MTKIDAAGANIIYSTYVGGSGLDRGDGIAIDSSGNAYVVGRVDSSSINFPATAGSFASSYRGGDFDGVVFKLNGQGNSLVYSGFLGGEENDSTEGVAVDAAGIAYVTGGAGEEARAAMAQLRPEFPLRVVFSDSSGAYVVADRVEVRGASGVLAVSGAGLAGVRAGRVFSRQALNVQRQRLRQEQPAARRGVRARRRACSSSGTVHRRPATCLR